MQAVRDARVVAAAARDSHLSGGPGLLLTASHVAALVAATRAALDPATGGGARWDGDAAPRATRGLEALAAALATGSPRHDTATTAACGWAATVAALQAAETELLVAALEHAPETQVRPARELDRIRLDT